MNLLYRIATSKGNPARTKAALTLLHRRRLHEVGQYLSRVETESRLRFCGSKKKQSPEADLRQFATN